MPEITESSIVDVRLGDQMAGALMVGTNEIYVRYEKHSFMTPGDFTFTLPEWAIGYGVLMSGGGGGGEAGSNSFGSDGQGGQGGVVRTIWGRLIEDKSRVLSGTIGAGGAGGSRAGAYGQSGGTSTFISHASNVYTAAGGTGNPTASSRDGDTKATVLSDPFHKYVNMALDSTYTNGPGGKAYGRSGTRGGGGGGGQGGVLGNYGPGGKGGDGFVDIYVWGYPRH